MKMEISAGGIVIRKSNSSWDVLLIKDMNNCWTFPKGLIEQGETGEVAAIREIQEETGLKHVTLLEPLSSIKYYYKHNGTIRKTVLYHLFITDGRESLIPQREEGVSKVRWIELKKALKLIGYKETNVPLLEKVQNIIKRLTL